MESYTCCQCDKSIKEPFSGPEGDDNVYCSKCACIARSEGKYHFANLCNHVQLVRQSKDSYSERMVEAMIEKFVDKLDRHFHLGDINQMQYDYLYKLLPN